MSKQASAYTRAARAAYLILGLNMLLCLAKIGGGWLGQSFALLVDGLNNLADAGLSVVLVIGVRIAARPPDHQHAYGHGKLEQELSRLISIVILVTGGGIIWEALKRLPQEHAPSDPLVLVIAGLSILVKFGMYRHQNRLAKRLSSQALAADALNHKTDMAATGCVLIGTIAVWMGGAAWAFADDVAAIGVGLFMVTAAGYTIVDVSSELLDRMPPPPMVEQICDLAGSFPGITGVEQIRGRKIGLYYFIDLHLEVSGEMTVKQAHLLGHQVKDWLIAEVPEIGDIIVHIEPTPTS